jgi:two-component system, NtrC family, sensor histidine kinase HydH
MLSDLGLRSRLAWVTGLRLFLLLTIFGVITVFYLQGSLNRYSESAHVLYTAFGTSFSLAAVYGLVLRRGKYLPALAVLQITGDAAIWSMFVYVSGGPTSGATSFYALSALVGAVLVGARGALLAAAIGLASYALLCAGFIFKWIAPPSDQAPDAYVIDPSKLAFPFLVNALGIFLVALLSGYLAERLRKAGGELEQAEERAVAAERLATLGRVAAGLAHEIRNPLGSIRGSIELLRDSTALSAEDRELCDIVTRESQRLESLVSDMMDLSKPRKPRVEKISLVALAKDVVALTSKSGERSDHGDVLVGYEGPSEGAVVLCDGEQMRQVVWNLVRNAIQVSAAGSSVRVVIAADREHCILSIIDQGPGVTEAQHERLFDAFYTTRTQGAGLGLAVVRRIIDDHKPMGASITVVSDADARPGAEFRVTLKTASR